MSNCESELGFLARDSIYSTDKPYSFRYDPPDSFPRHNLKTEMKRVHVYDARSCNPEIEEFGFTITSVPTAMGYEDFNEHKKIEEIYATELEDHLKAFFGAGHVRVIDYAVRRRHPKFPISTGENYENQQPATMVHLDFSRQEGVKMVNRLYGDRANEILQNRWSIVNAWRPLKGPLFDWPLAVCDARTFNQERDSQLADAVYPKWNYENVLVHFHPDQKWYYFSAMEHTETMLFKCTDSDDTTIRGCPHGAFQNPNRGALAAPRESIESRAFVFWSFMDNFPKEVGHPYGDRN